MYVTVSWKTVGKTVSITRSFMYLYVIDLTGKGKYDAL